MTKQEKLVDFIKRYICVNRQVEDLDSNKEIFNSGIVDSFGLIELLAYIEDEFEVKIENYEIVENEADTIEKIVDLINKRS